MSKKTVIIDAGGFWRTEIKDVEFHEDFLFEIAQFVRTHIGTYGEDHRNIEILGIKVSGLENVYRILELTKSDDTIIILVPIESTEQGLLDSTGNINTVRQWLAAGADVNAIDETGKTPLILAVIKTSRKPPHETHELLTELLRCGAEIDATDRSRYTALHWASYDRNLAAVRVLLAANADRHIKNKNQETALDIAIRLYDKDELVDLLLSRH